MLNQNNIKAIGLLLAIIVVFGLGVWMGGCAERRATLQQTEDTRIKTNVIYDTIYQPNTVYVPVADKTKPIPTSKTPAVISYDTVRVDSLIYIYEKNTCAGIYTYADSIDVPNSYKAIILDTISNNSIKGRSFQMADMRPQVIKTITNTIIKPPKYLPMLFVGATATFDNKGYGIGPSINACLPKYASIAYSYDVINKRHIASLYYPIILQKRNKKL
jgi:hypothetical protein